MRSTRLPLVPAAALLAAAVLAGCDPALSGVDDTGGHLPGDGRPDTDVDDASFFDQFEAREDCYGYDGQPIPGATSYFFGEFQVGEETVSGAEYWVLLANDRWKETGEDDCVVKWTVTGTVEEPEECFSCDYALSIQARIDLDDTTCPDGLHQGEEEWEERYNVRISDGRSEFEYVGSGDALGEGLSDPPLVTYVTPPRCMFF